MAVNPLKMNSTQVSMWHRALALALPRAALPNWLPGIGEMLPRRAQERLLVLTPALILPTAGTPADVMLLALLLLCLVLGDALVNVPGSAGFRPKLAAALVLSLVLALALAPGVALPLALLAAVAALERRASVPARLALGGLAGAIVVDMSLIALGFERCGLWLALGGAVGLAFAASHALAATIERAGTNGPSADTDHQRPLLEVVLVTALILVLSLYGALLAGEPLLATAAAAGGHLTVPLVAAIVWRVVDRALAGTGPGKAGFDHLTAGLVGLWALGVIALL